MTDSVASIFHSSITTCSMNWLRALYFIVAMAVVVACGDDDPTPNSPAGKSIEITQLSRTPFYGAYNPETQAPSIISDEVARRLEFSGWGNEDGSFTLTFPEKGEYRRVIMQYTMCCEGEGPADYDNVVLLYVRNKADGEWYECGRLFTPFGGMFDSSWERSYHLDVSEYASMLDGATEFRYYYGGFDATEERAHAFRLTFYCYEGENKCLGVESIYDSSLNPNTGYRSWAYGVAGYDIESDERLGKRTLHIPAGTREVLLRVAITGHGHDQGSFPDRAGYEVINAAEFDDNYYYFTLDGKMQQSAGHIFYSNANNYVQQGTYSYDRANWAPGNPANVQYWSIPYVTNEDATMSIDIDLERFVSSFDSPNAEGVANYIVSVYAFYMGE